MNFNETLIENKLKEWADYSTEDGFYAIHFSAFRGNIVKIKKKFKFKIL